LANSAFECFEFKGGIVADSAKWVVEGNAWSLVTYIDRPSGYHFKTDFIVEFESGQDEIKSIKQVDFVK
jgi:hypothetical protein